jgi:hypothetical protein
VKLHAPCLDLRQVENVVDQRKKVPARTEHAIEWLDVLLRNPCPTESSSDAALYPKAEAHVPCRRERSAFSRQETSEGGARLR